MGLKFFVDHCISNEMIYKLRDMGHEVLLLRELMPHDSPDLLVISKANELGSITITYLLERLKNYFSVFSDMSHYRGRLFLVEAHRIRVRG